SSGGGQLTGGADGWAPAYCISKTALNGVTVQLAAALPKFAVNSVCPGWVRTDMGGQNASRSVEEGAGNIVWVAHRAAPDLTRRFAPPSSCAIVKKFLGDSEVTAACRGLPALPFCVSLVGRVTPCAPPSFIAEMDLLVVPGR